MGVIFLKIGLLASLLAIFYQDQKERQVFWWLFMLVIITLSALHINQVGFLQFGISSAINSSIIISMLLILMGYVKIRMPSASFLRVFALGDILFLFGLALGFSTVSFVTLLVFGLLFSLLLHGVWKGMLSRKHISQKVSSNSQVLQYQTTTVPLAGYLALFFAGVLAVHWLGFYDHLYIL